MYRALNVKNWFHHIHVPGHETTVRLEHLIHDRRFWVAIGGIALIALLSLLVFWASQAEAPTDQPFPFTPYGPLYRFPY